jgi:probable F420-dependent oxidoreductase
LLPEDLMKIGFSLPQFGGHARHANEIASYARTAEELGADSLWTFDRLLAPVHPEVGYGGGDTPFPEEYHAILDPFVVLGVAASATERALIGSNIIVAPMYPPALLARSLLTIDQVSGGRLVAGLGLGWSPDEFAAAGIPLTERGRRFDEGLDALERLWTANPAEYRGRYWQVPATYSALKPVKRPPIYLGGGFAPAAMRRIALRADGWIPVVVLPGEVDLDAAVNQPLARIRSLAAEVGRDKGELDVILRIVPVMRTEPAEIIGFIERVEKETTVRHVMVDLLSQTGDVASALEDIRTILSGVRSRVGA